MPLASINLYTLKQVRVSRHRYDLESCRLACSRSCYLAIQLVLDLKHEAVEKFGIVSLNTKNRIVGVHVISVGSLNVVNVSMREVFAAAIINNAASIVAFHNHPSGDPTPSADDLILTKQLKAAGELLGIGVVDHIIVGEDGYVSLREKGLI